MKKEAVSTAEGRLVRPYEPFYGSPLPISTEVIITNENEHTYSVKFPGKIGYSGTFSISKVYVEIINQ